MIWRWYGGWCKRFSRKMNEINKGNTHKSSQSQSQTCSMIIIWFYAEHSQFEVSIHFFSPSSYRKKKLGSSTQEPTNRTCAVQFHRNQILKMISNYVWHFQMSNSGSNQNFRPSPKTNIRYTQTGYGKRDTLPASCALINNDVKSIEWHTKLHRMERTDRMRISSMQSDTKLQFYI